MPMDEVVHYGSLLLHETLSNKLIRLCQSFLNFELPSARCEKRVAKFEQKLVDSQNLFCKLYTVFRKKWYILFLNVTSQLHARFSYNFQ